MAQGQLTITTSSVAQLLDITTRLEQELAQAASGNGICHLFNPHTTAGLTINEGCDPAVKDDILAGFQKLVPMHLAYKHLEGNSPAHIMTSLMGSSLTLFVTDGRLLLGTWQKVFFCEFDGPRTRTIHWRLLPA